MGGGGEGGGGVCGAGGTQNPHERAQSSTTWHGKQFCLFSGVPGGKLSLHVCGKQFCASVVGETKLEQSNSGLSSQTLFGVMEQSSYGDPIHALTSANCGSVAWVSDCRTSTYCYTRAAPDSALVVHAEERRSAFSHNIFFLGFRPRLQVCYEQDLL